MYRECICGCQATEMHHIMFRSQVKALEKCELNQIYLCSQCHRGTYGVHGKNGHELDQKLKKQFQDKLNAGLNDINSVDDIKAMLGISYKNVDKLLKCVQASKGVYKREDIVRACMNGKIILEEGE